MSSIVRSPFAKPFIIPCFTYTEAAQAARGGKAGAGLLRMVFSDKVLCIGGNSGSESVCSLLMDNNNCYYAPVSAATLCKLFEHHGYQSYGVEDILAFEGRQKQQKQPAALALRQRNPL